MIRQAGHSEDAFECNKDLEDAEFCDGDEYPRHLDYPKQFAHRVHKRVVSRCKNANTRQYSELTKINLSASIETFDELAGTSNDKKLSADKMGAWASENYPQFEKLPFDGQPFDAKMSGGGNKVVVESETAGGNRDVAKDAQKLSQHDGPASVRTLFIRQKSSNHYGREDERARRMSEDGKGPVMLVEERIAHNAQISSGSISTKLYADGEITYEELSGNNTPNKESASDAAKRFKAFIDKLNSTKEEINPQ